MPPLKKKDAKTTTRTTPARSDPDGPKATTQADPKNKADPDDPAKASRDRLMNISPAFPSDPRLTLPWMPKWIVLAVTSGSVDKACELTGVSVAEVVAARDADPAFDEACRLREKVADLMITDSLCAGAMDGDIRSQSLYFTKVRELVIKTEVKEQAEEHLTADEAAAALHAALDVREATAEETIARNAGAKTEATTPPPAPSPSRPRARRSRDSKR